MTFSIAARCARTGRFGVVVTSSSPAVAARCAHARSGVGAVTTQNVTDPSLGPKALDLMAAGLSAEASLAELVKVAPYAEYRQLTLVDRNGGTACFSGANTLGVNAMIKGRDVVSAGNLLASPSVPAAVLAVFEARPMDDLGDRLLAAMQAGVDAGGEAGPLYSAGMLIVDKVSWAVADLRIDWQAQPIAALGDLWRLWQPQMMDYVTRALNPGGAPSYGVPGDA